MQGGEFVHLGINSPLHSQSVRTHGRSAPTVCLRAACFIMLPPTRLGEVNLVKSSSALVASRGRDFATPPIDLRASAR